MNLQIITQILFFITLGLANVSRPAEAIVQIQFGDLFGSAVVVLHNLSANSSTPNTTTAPRWSNQTVEYPTTEPPTCCLATAVPPRFVNSTTGNTTGGVSSYPPSASWKPTPTNLTSFSGAQSHYGHISVLTISSIILLQLSV